MTQMYTRRQIDLDRVQSYVNAHRAALCGAVFVLRGRRAVDKRTARIPRTGAAELPPHGQEIKIKMSLFICAIKSRRNIDTIHDTSTEHRSERHAGAACAQEHKGDERR
jgi:hypothetical protein